MSFKKTVKLLFVLGFSCLVLLCCSWLVAKQVITSKAITKAEAIIQKASTSPEDREQFVINIAQHIFTSFETKEPWTVPALRIRPYITNDRLPEFLRLQHGVIETLIEQGYCDNAARMLSFILKQEGIDSAQWDMVTSSRGHSALLVSLTEDKQALVDPFYGVVAKMDDHLISPKAAQEFIQSGMAIRSIFHPLGSDSKFSFYDDYGRTYMARLGDDLLIEASIPQLNSGKPLFLGKIDGSEEDVKSAASAHGMTPYWQYAGHKYNRNWVRVLKADVPVRIEMTLVKPVETGVITSTPLPSIDGKKLSWDLDAGEQITFRDGLAKISFKRMNSFIGVDQIAIYRR